MTIVTILRVVINNGDDGGGGDDDKDVNRGSSPHRELPAVVVHRCGLNFAKLFRCPTSRKPSRIQEFTFLLFFSGLPAPVCV